ncbi:hypothetical protein N7466_003235 [Penicillium verhagenii]|uniref:uncharacterized protein n=1 Tax=Penicillium verhagenii TaxID=1562060 RepID=UPI0025459030|nr:uncharacterized protein N7466_003235 [Penicillium verhagenii]KAJ5936785.1 hypothetical protein N7466_003235 [Penicillium verhagenii]
MTEPAAKRPRRRQAAGVHLRPEVRVKIADTVRDPQTERTQGEKGAGLEIAATVTEGTTEIGMVGGLGIEKGVPAETTARIVAKIDEVDSSPKHLQFQSLFANNLCLHVAPASKYDKFRERSRSRSPAGNGTNAARSPPPRGNKDDRRPSRREPRSHGDGRQANGAHIKEDEMDVDFKEDADEDEMEAMMRKAMGFSRFRSTKNTKVPGNDIYGVRKEKKTEYRQYMNRTGGFNRPLSPSR